MFFPNVNSCLLFLLFLLSNFCFLILSYQNLFENLDLSKKNIYQFKIIK